MKCRSPKIIRANDFLNMFYGPEQIYPELKEEDKRLQLKVKVLSTFSSLDTEGEGEGLYERM